LPVQIPEVLGRGVPSSKYPLAWSVLSWIGGSNPLPKQVVGNSELVADVASFLTALQQADVADAPQAYRGGVWAERDNDVRAALLELRGRADVVAAEVMWDQALSAGQWTSQPVWAHSDLMPGNLLLNNGRLVGVLDFEAAGVGDPACDLMVAWNLLDGEGRKSLRDKLKVDDDTWMRGRGWALSQALVALPYYWDTNPAMVNTATYVLQQLNEDADIRQ
jgi:aminoglycoside phosphotransferase (APT) family kinase protein